MQTSDLIASLALFISILSLWLQTISSNKQFMLSNFIEYTRRYQEIIIHFPKDLVNSEFDITLISESERENLLRYMWLYFDLCNEEYCLYKLGFINTQLWNIWELGMKSSFSRPAFQQCWEIISKNSNFESDLRFINFIESMIGNSSN